MCLALLAFSGLLSAGPGIGLSPVWSALRAYCGRWRSLLQRMTLIRQARQDARRRERRASGEQHHADYTAGISLSPIELALIAELNLEIARAHDKVADAVSASVETRRAALTAATALRERAGAFHREARCISTESILNTASRRETASASTGPDRRRQGRRTEARRRESASAVDAVGRGERRATPDRRQRQRRGHAS